MQETRVQSLVWEDSLEEEVATHSSSLVLPGDSHGQRSLVGYSPWGCKESDRTEYVHPHAEDHQSLALCLSSHSGSRSEHYNTIRKYSITT